MSLPSLFSFSLFSQNNYCILFTFFVSLSLSLLILSLSQWETNIFVDFVVVLHYVLRKHLQHQQQPDDYMHYPTTPPPQVYFKNLSFMVKKAAIYPQHLKQNVKREEDFNACTKQNTKLKFKMLFFVLFLFENSLSPLKRKRVKINRGNPHLYLYIFAPNYRSFFFV